MGTPPEETVNRKLDHILLTVERSVESKESSLLEYVRLIHNPVPEVNLDNVRTTKRFCSKVLRAPLMITGMTGGHPRAAEINRMIGELAEEHGIAAGVGSQRAGIERPDLAYTYKVMRDAAPNAFIVANIGAPQLVMGYSLKQVEKAVEMIEADAIAIHLNVGQELYQYEGDPFYEGVIDKIIEIAETLKVPVIVKETGAGLSYEAVRALYRLGVKCFDTSGLGGTSWIKVEGIRAAESGVFDYYPPGPMGDYWGNPTALSIIETRLAAPDAYIVGSGGIRHGLDAAKAIALGADIAGFALPLLRALLNGGLDAARKFLATTIYQISTVIAMTGGKKVEDLWRAPLTIWGRLRDEASARGIDLHGYIFRGRLSPLLVGRE